MKHWKTGWIVFFAAAGFQCPVFADKQAAAKPELLLVYWSSKDCRWCTYWESSWSGMENGLKNSEEFKKLTYRVVKNDRLADSYKDSDYPPDLKWLKERVDRGEEKIPVRPSWFYFVNKVRVYKFSGTRDWDSKILPKIKQLVTSIDPDQPVGQPDVAR